MIWRCAWEWEAQGDVHGLAERSDFDRRHANVMVWGYDGVEFAAYGTDEYGVGWKWAGDPSLACGRRQYAVVFITKAAVIARVGIQGA